MGRYNPNIPRILGQEWVPIRDEDITYNQFNNNVERGYTFTTDASRILTQGKFYINKYPEGFFKEEVMTISVYQAGKEDESGPIRSVLIPCNNGGITGGTPNVWSLFRATSVADALSNSSDNRYLRADFGSNPAVAFASAFFAVNQYSQLLQGKRILGVNLLYTAQYNGCSVPDASIVRLSISTPTTTNQVGQWQYPPLFAGPEAASVAVPFVFKQGVLNRVYLGDTNLFFGSTTTSSSPPINVMPWTYSELQRFELTNASPYSVLLQGIPGFNAACSIDFGYMALEVIFCEETRIAVGSTVYNITTDAGGFAQFTYIMGGNSVQLRNPVTMALNPTLDASTAYTVTLAQSNLGDGPLRFFGAPVGPQPLVNGLRELYSISSLPAVELTIPFPPDEDIDGQTFTIGETHIIPQLSLYTSGGPLTEIHPYGRQAVAQVWGTITATQEIYDAGMASTASYPQVRFYARRFGDTTVPLKLTFVAQPTIHTSITPSVFDSLDEILDGWKEVTLSFITAPTLGGGTNPQWSFSAPGELAGNRWEILGAAAPALSGLPGQELNLAGSFDQLYAATYGAPVSGAAINLGWVSGISPLVSATTDDRASDAVLIFSQDMPTITGMGIQVLNQAVSGIGQNCGINPAFIPDQIQYNHISWPAQQAFTVFDNFTRVSASGWGNATSGQAWTLDGGVGTDYTVDGSSGVITLTASGSSRHTSVLTNTFLDIDGYGQISMTTLPTVAMTWGALVWHKESAVNDMYQAELDFMTDSSVALAIRKWVGGVDTVLATIVIGYKYVLGTKYNLRIRQRGYAIQARAWLDGTDEPTYWQLQVSDFDLTDPAGVGTRTRIDAGGGTPQVVLYDNITFTDPNFGAFELQRMDTVDTAWQTIMLATSPTVSGFNDFEARVGLLSSYRIRMLNVLNFAGPWSSTVTSTIPEPGVSGTAITADTAVLIFTSNERQDGAINLAYSNAWEGSVNEEFTFPEAAFVQLQSMYNKDFFTAFRPLERGGERFTRTVLVQAAAIAPPTLADFTSLRDMAWDSVNYICVRDQEGNRWFATVLVPSGKVQHFRRLYMAEVDIVEVTDTPTPVDPS
jgi:hypothetical protein